jgi:hypothetical protein
MALQHKEGFRQVLTQLAKAAGAEDPDRLADHLILLSEGAITRSAISGGSDPAVRAREAATMILDASLPH